jgi:cell division septum initiation protein DivIVA
LPVIKRINHIGEELSESKSILNKRGVIMNITELRKSLFGYSKESVYQYISYLNQEFSQKLVEKDRESNYLIKELQERNAALEKEMESIRAENDIYKKMQSSISESIISAKNYEKEIKDAAVLENKKIRETINEEKQKQEMQLKNYIETIDAYRVSLVHILKEFETSLKNISEEGHGILKESPIYSENKETETAFEQQNYNTDLQNMNMFKRNDINIKTGDAAVEKRAK